jgi:hypothetical protein
MIAMTISLIVLVVMMQAFRRASGEIKRGRAMIELAAEMRAVGETFRRDMAHLTVSPRVWNLTSESDGYFEIIEGPRNDATYHAFANDGNDNDSDGQIDEEDERAAFTGDYDDVIAMTVRSGEKPFRGRWVDAGGNTRMLESHVAEIVWFVVHENIDDTIGFPNMEVDLDDRVTLYRRVLLVLPDDDPDNPGTPIPLAGTTATIDDFFRNNDISVRPAGPNLVLNTLSDLTLRENRYAHSVAAFPYEIQGTMLRDRRVPTGEDILLTNVAGFDLRVFSPDAPMKAPAGNQFLGPNDPNWTTNTTANTNEGAFVDLGWDPSGADTSWFAAANSDPPAAPPQRFSVGNTWCSWSPHYVYGTTAADGLDNNGNGLVDEEEELTTAIVRTGDPPGAHAPYPWPIRAVELTMRGIEKSTRNVRQVTIVSSFVPE